MLMMLVLVPWTLEKPVRLPSDLAEHCQLMILVLIFCVSGKSRESRLMLMMLVSPGIGWCDLGKHRRRMLMMPVFSP